MSDELAGRPGGTEDEVDETLADPEPATGLDETAEQDFATRNVAMSNALPTNAAAGAVVGSGGVLGMDPETDEEETVENGGPALGR